VLIEEVKGKANNRIVVPVRSEEEVQQELPIDGGATRKIRRRSPKEQ
jgi:hypothetical protein